VGNEGDIGLNPPRYEDTSYHGYSTQSVRSDGRTLSRGESYEMDEYDMSSFFSELIEN